MNNNDLATSALNIKDLDKMDMEIFDWETFVSLGMVAREWKDASQWVLGKLALGVEKVFWGEFLDKSKSEEKGRSAFSDTWNQTGLFYTGTWAKKPGYFTHRLLATALDNFAGATQLTPNIVKFTFSNRSPIYLVWPKGDENE